MACVIKFGGSSLGTTEKVQNVAKYLVKRAEKEKIVVVVSAMGKTTNELLALADKTGNAGSRQTLASLITQGENLSAALLCYTLEGLKAKALWLDAESAHIFCKGDPLNAVITYIDKTPITKALETNDIVVVCGFQGFSENGVCALGRGGSDTTAVALAVALSTEVEIRTDVDGFYDKNPNEFQLAKRKDTINIYSAIESATAGAKVLDKRCLTLANKYKKNISLFKETEEKFSRLDFEALEGFKVDCISYKTGFLFVEKQTKYIEILQSKNQNCNIQPLFMQKYEEKVVAFFEEKICPFCTPCDLVIVAGSGLTEVSQADIKIDDIIYLSINPTFIKLVVKNGSGHDCVEKLSNLFLKK